MYTAENIDNKNRAIKTKTMHNVNTIMPADIFLRHSIQRITIIKEKDAIKNINNEGRINFRLTIKFDGLFK